MIQYFKIYSLFIVIMIGFMIKLFVVKTKYGSFDHIVGLFSKTLYYILIPIVFADIFALRGVMITDLKVAFVAFFYVLISAIIFQVLRIIWHVDLRLLNALTITSIFQNAIFLGFPVILVFYGDISYASVYSLVMLIQHITVAGLLAAKRREIVRSVLTIPVIYGFLLGLIIHYSILSYYIRFSWIGIYSSLVLTYGAAFVLGYSLPPHALKIRAYMEAFIILCLHRFMLSPIIHVVLASMIGVPVGCFRQLLVESLMPPAIMNTLISRIYGWDYEFASTTTLITTFISIPLVFALYFCGIL